MNFKEFNELRETLRGECDFVSIDRYLKKAGYKDTTGCVNVNFPESYQEWELKNHVKWNSEEMLSGKVLQPYSYHLYLNNVGDYIWITENPAGAQCFLYLGFM